MGTGEVTALFRQPFHVRCLDIGMSTQKAHPIVEIVETDHENVGLRPVLISEHFCGEKQEQQEGELPTKLHLAMLPLCSARCNLEFVISAFVFVGFE